MTYRIAVGTVDGKNITEHFGQCRAFKILDISQEDGSVIYVEDRLTGHQEQCGGHQDAKVLEKINALSDCQIVLVKQIGGQSEKLLIHYGIIPLQNQGSIEAALVKVKAFYKRQLFS